MDQEPKRKHPAHHHDRHHAKPHKAKPRGKAKPKHAGSKPAARQPGELPRPKQAAVPVRDVWADASIAPTVHREIPARRESEEQEEEHENPVATGLGLAEDAHLGAEGWFGRHIHGDTLKELAEEISEESAEIWDGEASVGQHAFFGAGAIGSTLGVVGGALELYEGVQEYQRDPAKGITTGLGGLASITSGATGVAALAGVGGAALSSTLLASFGAGLKIGGNGNEDVKELGWLHDENGNAESASSWLADQGGAADDWVATHTHNETLGRIAGAGTMALMLPGAGMLAAGGAIASPAVKGVHALNRVGTGIGKHAANEKRADLYSGARSGSLDAVDGIGARNPYTGQVEIAARGTQAAILGGQQMADYDDDRDEAIERAKVLHPERWGKEQNALSAYNEVAERIAKGTHGK